jgi:hypothetical protein
MVRRRILRLPKHLSYALRVHLTSNMLYGQPKGAPQQDEGKMSVSIDFGMSFRFNVAFCNSYCYVLGTTFSGVVSSHSP